MLFVRRQSKTLWAIKPTKLTTRQLVWGAPRPSIINTTKGLPNWWSKGEREYYRAIGCDMRKALLVWFSLRHPKLRLGRIDNRVCDIINRNLQAANALSFGYTTLV